MKTLKRPLIIASTLTSMSILLSWNLLDDYPSTSNSSNYFSHAKMLENEASSGFVSNNGLDQIANRPPGAEDVLVERIPGDNSHLLIMAYYSKKTYSGPSVTINNGSAIVLTDDGSGYDKVAGDGIYTARIPADVAAFRNQALGLIQKTAIAKFEPIRYLNRQRIIDPDAGEGFELAKFDANEPVSVSALTNALSATSVPSLNAAAATPTLDGVKQKSVVITHLSVVEDPTRTWNFVTQTGNKTGAWSFNTLIRNLASKNRAKVATDKELSDFIKVWLAQFASTQTVNGDVVAPRPIANAVILEPWLKQSQDAGAPAGQLDMRFAPFKLIAITNRFDLRDGEAFGNAGQPCGEGRFVFTLIASKDGLNGDANVKKGDALKMTIILEARVNKKNSCSSKRDWAQQWVNLANLPLPSSQYNDALQIITDQFSSIGATPNAPNQNSLSQLRTNEIALESLVFGVGTWQLREFNLINKGNPNSNGKGGVDLKMATNKMAPIDNLNGAGPTSSAADVQRLADFINENKDAINKGSYSVPNTYKGAPFLGAVSKVNGFPVAANFPGFITTGFHWDGASSGAARIENDEARFNFSLQTCSGCHAGESQTFFTHIDNVKFGQEATLSGFVSGKRGQFAADADGNDNDGVFSVKDPGPRPNATSPTVRSFNEIDRRAKDLLNVVNTSCGSPLAISSELLFRATPSAH